MIPSSLLKYVMTVEEFYAEHLSTQQPEVEVPIPASDETENTSTISDAMREYNERRENFLRHYPSAPEVIVIASIGEPPTE